MTKNKNGICSSISKALLECGQINKPKMAYSRDLADMD